MLYSKGQSVEMHTTFVVLRFSIYNHLLWLSSMFSEAYTDQVSHFLNYDLRSLERVSMYTFMRISWPRFWSDTKAFTFVSSLLQSLLLHLPNAFPECHGHIQVIEDGMTKWTPELGKENGDQSMHCIAASLRLLNLTSLWKERQWELKYSMARDWIDVKDGSVWQLQGKKMRMIQEFFVGICEGG